MSFSAFIASLINAIIQLVYLSDPSAIESGTNFFQGRDPSTLELHYHSRKPFLLRYNSHRSR